MTRIISQQNQQQIVPIIFRHIEQTCRSVLVQTDFI